MSKKIIYQLVINDLQLVAMEILNRKLTPSEIQIISIKISDQIDWYDAISSVISDNIKQSEV
ncbi:MAG: hypothetical protein ACOYO1_18720 [Bacteroidales bacterium]